MGRLEAVEETEEVEEARDTDLVDSPAAIVPVTVASPSVWQL